MNKTIIFILVILVSISGLFAESVDLNTAEKIAVNWYKQYVPVYNDAAISSRIVNEKKNINTFYTISFKSGGFVLVAADNAVIPILGFAFKGEFDKEIVQPGFVEWISAYEDELVYVIENNKENTETIYMWEAILANNFSKDDPEEVLPLIETRWSQGDPYNMYCPEDAEGPGGHALVGCVATAMSQIMKYYEFPIQGTGSHSYYHPDYGSLSANFGEAIYDWHHMPVQANANTPQGDKEALALISYHCGVGVEMNYGPDGSGAYSGDVPAVMRDYFNYASDITIRSKYNYSITNWENFLIDDLNNYRPLYYSGRGDDGGHAFVLDGYQDTDNGKYFHFNWGWGGSSDGYYYLNNLNPGGSTFNIDQRAIMNIEPTDERALFYADVTRGIEPMVVNFTDVSTGDPISWEWDFGDGATSTAQNPQHTFLESGLHTISLTISDGENEFTKTRTEYIDVLASDELVGIINFDRTLSDDTVRVMNNITIIGGVKLSIDPGVVLELQGNSKILIKGELLAEGAENDSIIFTVKDTTGFSDPSLGGGWEGLEFSGTPAAEENSILNYCKIEYVKKSFAVNALHFKNLKIYNSEISNCYGVGLFNLFVDTDIRNSSFKNIRLYPSSQYTNMSPAISCFSGNLNLNNVLFSGNYCKSKGVISLNNSASEFTNVSIVNNISEANVLGMVYLESGSQPIFTNSILWNENAPEVYFSGNNSLTSSYSNIQGGENSIVNSESGTVNWLDGNIEENPQFVINSDSLNSWSACINAGSPDTSGLGLSQFDLNGNPRIFDGESDIIDMGVYEFQGEPVFYDVGFSASILSGFAPLTVQFTDTSSSGITGWQWDFNNDGIVDSTTQNPSWTFNRAGFYSVKLVYEIDDVRITETKAEYIEVLNAIPVVIYEMDSFQIFEDEADSTIILQTIFNDPDSDSLSFGIIGGENISMTIFDSLVVLCPDSNWFGSEEMILSATDEYGDFVNDTVIVTVLPVNDAPFFTELVPDTLIIKENSSDTLALTGLVVDIDDPDSSLGWIFTAGNFVQVSDTLIDNKKFAIFNPENNIYGLDTIKVVISDTSNTVDSISIIIKVLSVNTAPTFTYLFPDTIYFAADEIDTLQLNGLAEDVETPDSLLVWSLNHGALIHAEIESDQSVRIWVENDESGLDSLILTVSDSLLEISDTIIVKVNPRVGISNEQQNIPGVFALHQNFPNPFNPTTTIAYETPEQTDIEIVLFDLKGHKVKTLIKSIQPAGHYTVFWNGRSDKGLEMPSGVYIYSMRAGNFHTVKKMLLVK